MLENTRIGINKICFRFWWYGTQFQDIICVTAFDLAESKKFIALFVCAH